MCVGGAPLARHPSLCLVSVALEGDGPYQCIDAVTDSIVAIANSWFSVSAAGAELESAGMVVEGP